MAWARALLWTLQLIPIAFVFRIRANQEYLMLAGFIVALYGTERPGEILPGSSWRSLGFLYALSVKGMLALIGPPSLRALAAHDVRARATVAAGAWAGVALMMSSRPSSRRSTSGRTPR